MKKPHALGSVTHMACLIVGVLALLTGLVWVGQGTGIFPYPQQSFMINQRPWVWYGLLSAAVGVSLIVYSRVGRRA